MFKVHINRLFVFKALSAAVVLASVIVCIHALSEAWRHTDRDVFLIAPRVNDSAFYFGMDEAERLKSVCNAEKLSYSALGRGSVSSSAANAHSRIVLTNSEFFQLSNTQFAQGAAWPATGEGENVAVVDGPLTWRLFRSLSVVDMEITILNERYTIVGAIAGDSAARDSSARASAVQGGAPSVDGTVYIPMGSVQRERSALSEPEISAVYLKIASYSKLGTYDDIGEVFREIWKDSRDYYLTDINMYVGNIGLKYKLLVFLIGLYAAAIIIVNTYKLARCSQTSRKAILMLAGMFVLDVVFLALLARGVSFEVWIPHGGASRLDDIVGAITNGGLLPPVEYLTEGLSALAELNRRANVALAAGTAGLANFVFVHKAVR